MEQEEWALAFIKDRQVAGTYAKLSVSPVWLSVGCFLSSCVPQPRFRETSRLSEPQTLVFESSALLSPSAGSVGEWSIEPHCGESFKWMMTAHAAPGKGKMNLLGGGCQDLENKLWTLEFTSQLHQRLARWQLMPTTLCWKMINFSDS